MNNKDKIERNERNIDFLFTENLIQKELIIELLTFYFESTIQDKTILSEKKARNYYSRLFRAKTGD